MNLVDSLETGFGCILILAGLVFANTGLMYTATLPITGIALLAVGTVAVLFGLILALPIPDPEC